MIHRKNVNNHVSLHCSWLKNLQLYLNKYNRWKETPWLLENLPVLGTLLLLLSVGHIDLNNGVIVMYDYIRIGFFFKWYRLKTLHAISTLLFGWVVWPTGIIIENRKTADTSQLRIEITMSYKMIFFSFWLTKKSVYVEFKYQLLIWIDLMKHVPGYLSPCCSVFSRLCEQK